ncbi:MAG: bifunctional adenosylcobinamide kinase/adenosylcobinamide-phosphate guanylyltransferase [Actinobacteria bacterium]|nr:bifunctional adenosylcobinamide kinase/adenosylcobinamide-phosphate guanylyltransferase [Actinomycetota bacterium]
MRIRMLGTGAADGWPNPFCTCNSCAAERAAGRSRTSSAAIIDGIVLIDCGPTTTHAAVRAAVELSGVEHVLITHGHPDHLAPEFLLWREWIPDLRHLHVWGPRAAIDRCRHWVGPDSPVSFHVVKPGDEVLAQTQGGTYRVRVVRASHGHGNGDELADEAVLYDLTAPDHSRLFYATDTGPLGPAQIASLSGRAFDVVLIDESFGFKDDHGTGHLDLTTLPITLTALRSAAAITDATDVIAIHLSHHNPPERELRAALHPMGARIVDDLAIIDTATGSPPTRHLIIGGVRSGKSTYAEALAALHPNVTYVATGESRADDVEWLARVDAHRSRRPAHWRTVETADLAALLEGTESGEVLLIDCLGMWLTRQLDQADAWSDDPEVSAAAVVEVSARIEALAAATGTTRAHVLMVTNEVGQGVVPATSSGRLFRDLMGIANRRLSLSCNDVTFMVAGRPLPMGTLP